MNQKFIDFDFPAAGMAEQAELGAATANQDFTGDAKGKAEVKLAKAMTAANDAGAGHEGAEGAKDAATKLALDR